MKQTITSIVAGMLSLGIVAVVAFVTFNQVVVSQSGESYLQGFQAGGKSVDDTYQKSIANMVDELQKTGQTVFNGVDIMPVAACVK